MELSDYLTVCIYNMCLQIIYSIYIYIYLKMCPLNNQQCFLYYKTKQNQLFTANIYKKTSFVLKKQKNRLTVIEKYDISEKIRWEVSNL